MDDSALQQAIHGVTYPAGKQELLAAASTNDAAEAVKKAINALPDGRFENADEVRAATRRRG